MACRLPLVAVPAVARGIAAMAAATLPAMTPALIAPAASADVAYAQVAQIARAANPGRPLLGIRHRVRNDGEAFFISHNVNAFNTLVYQLEIDPVTGAVLDENLEDLLPPLDLETQPVLDRLSELTLDFAPALAIANAATGRTEADVARLDLSSEMFMIFYDVRYHDGARIMVDGATGRVIAHGDEATTDNTTTPALLAANLAAARAAAGPGWVLFDASVLMTAGGLAVDTMFLRPLNGQVKHVTLRGAEMSVEQFLPIGRIQRTVEEIRPQVPTVVVGAEDFLGHVAKTFPGALVADVGLQSQLREDGSIRTRWNTMLLTAAGESIEYAVDATLPIGQGLAFAQLATPRVTGDLTGDGRVLADDLAELFATYGQEYPPHDLDGDGTVRGGDLAILLQHWG
jgi:hypothetical protein